ncbi:uncharacterized protein [Amphiura filiformis]|uniref:uncharacterized protein isoform X3 n=1 Tax=Amphiura filiformis TaxID=82378 RepID=UPI003B2191CB
MGGTLLKNKVPVDIVDEGPIHMLGIDTLLVIFNYLSLYDKLMAMRNGYCIIEEQSACRHSRRGTYSYAQYRYIVGYIQLLVSIRQINGNEGKQEMASDNQTPCCLDCHRLQRQRSQQEGQRFSKTIQAVCIKQWPGRV